MKGLKCTEQTRMLSIALFTLYFIYGICKIPLLEYVTCLAIGAVIYGITKSIEFGLLGLLIANLILPMFRSSKEGFATEEKADPKTVATKADPATVATKTDPNPVPTEKADPPASVTGVVSADVVGASGVTGTPTSASFAGTSTPAPAATKDATTKQISEKVPPANQPADLVQDGFENKADAGLFKLGVIPTDEKGGFHIDSGTSVLNALKSLKPDQISAMTQDTKQLIETQKTLMNMLQSFKPMMSEGKEMMDTFQQMFSPAGGSAMGALQAAQNTLKS